MRSDDRQLSPTPNPSDGGESRRMKARGLQQRVRLHADGQEDEREAGTVEAFLDGEDGVVVEPAGGDGVLRENELAAEEDAIGVFGDDLGGDAGQFFHHIRAERVEPFGVVAVLAHVIDIVIDFIQHVSAQAVDFIGALEVARVDDSDLDEDEVLEDAAEHAEHAEESVEPQAVEAADEDDGGLGLRVALGYRLGLVGGAHAGFGGGDFHQVIEPAQQPSRVTVMSVDEQGDDDQTGCQYDRDGAALAEFNGRHQGEDRGAEDKAKAVDEHFLEAMFDAFFRNPPVAYHAELRQREGDEDIDAVQHHQELDAASRQQHHAQRGATHQQDAVLRDQAVAERCKLRRHPTIEGHVGEHARTVEEARLRGDKQQHR